MKHTFRVEPSRTFYISRFMTMAGIPSSSVHDLLRVRSVARFCSRSKGIARERVLLDPVSAITVVPSPKVRAPTRLACQSYGVSAGHGTLKFGLRIFRVHYDLVTLSHETLFPCHNIKPQRPEEKLEAVRILTSVLRSFGSPSLLSRAMLDSA